MKSFKNLFFLQKFNLNFAAEKQYKQIIISIKQYG